MKYGRVYTDPFGETHFEDLGDVPFTLANYAPPAPPFDVSPFAQRCSMAFFASRQDGTGTGIPCHSAKCKSM
jgi:hypothetical protein